MIPDNMHLRDSSISAHKENCYTAILSEQETSTCHYIQYFICKSLIPVTQTGPSLRRGEWNV